MVKNFTKLMKHNKPQTKEAQGTPSRINTHTYIHTHIHTYTHTHPSLDISWSNCRKPKPNTKFLRQQEKSILKYFKKHITIATIFHICDLIVKNNKTGISNTY